MNNLLKHIIIFTAGILPAVSLYSQADSLPKLEQESSKRKFKQVAIGTGIVYGVGLIGLNRLWYADFEKSNFQTFNDNNEWLQVDKVGHSYSAYTLAKMSYHLYPKNYSKKKKIIYSGSSSFLFLSTIEIFDGFSKEWGFSWGDFLANTSGIGLFSVQELLFDEQIIQFKYSYHNTVYSKIRPATLGENTLQKAFKDYNGQTYWLSFSLSDVYSNKIIPEWLSLSFGYGGTNMVLADSEPGIFEGMSFHPRREFYISLDVNWSKVKTKNEYLRWLLRVANSIKIPAPTIRFKKGEDPVFYGVYF